MPHSRKHTNNRMDRFANKPFIITLNHNITEIIVAKRIQEQRIK